MSHTVLVTGGTGFVAGWTIVDLLKQGHTVRATVRSLARVDSVRAAVESQTPAGERLTFAVADLNADAGWDEAASGCDYVLHIASPLGGAAEGGAAEDGEALIAAAREGTIRLLRASVAAGVKRVVMTSSTAACTPAPPPGRAIDENDWTDPNQPGLAAYRKSKVLAEQAAWAFMEGRATELTTILPGAIFGPVLTQGQQGSVGIIRGMLNSKPPVLPRLAFNIIDVRDLAELHVRAMLEPRAAGQRFIAMGEALWFGEVAQTLRERLGEGAAKVSTRKLPDVAARALALFSPQMKQLLPLLGRTQPFSTAKARDLLRFSPRPARDTVADCGASLIGG